jgi:hypothetical protein
MKMKEATARRLEIGSRVSWDNNPKDGGTVIETGFSTCKVKWDDPSNVEVSLPHFNEIANIGSLLPNRKYPPGYVIDVTEIRL